MVGLAAVAEHLPATQWLLQHCISIVHVVPLALQFATQIPVTQWLLQHWLLIEQVIPLALQEGLTVGVAVGLGIQHLIPGDAQLL